MKNFITINLFTFFAALSLFSCDREEVKTLNKLDGEWSVTQITFTTADGQELTLDPLNSSIKFDECDKKDNQTPNSCSASYVEDGTIKASLFYQLTVDNSSSVLSIKEDPDGSLEAIAFLDYFNGLNDIFFSNNDTQLNLECTSCSGTFDGQNFESRIVILER